jgi:predicted P-loop ATPase
MEINQFWDLIQDEYGNYYHVKCISDNTLYLVNAIAYFSFKRIANENFLNDVNKKYEKSVGVGQYFTDQLKSRIDGLKSKKYPGEIFQLNDVVNFYSVSFMPLYERELSNK